MTKVLLLASILWPTTLGAAAWTSIRGEPAPWTGIVYLAASRVCHQRPDRSFHTAGVQWPVCGRCSGLYLAAPLGALAAAATAKRRARSASALVLVGAAAVPTVVTIALEWLHVAPISNLARALAALPLGAAIAFVLIRTAGRPLDRGRVN
jgi:uncharacterized membrane protein